LLAVGLKLDLEKNPGTKLKTKKIRGPKPWLKQGGGGNDAGHFRH
jgi:hypothetical protein